ncbi:carbohydrate ABC transporter permease [Paenibacillus aceti]|uniref:Sugar ABC transporter permease n=1 Tax=Paenibacillus aceti TaxID=1820010 RepID=A0ABQ1VS41_9BACL|nr:carbohydrate ABC transporter permease [Paenibacillus aceti]GGF93569.1 sugar ABC transporter permease [Paenibacillus aceti]
MFGRNRMLGRLAIHTVLCFGALLMVGPFIWMLLTSVKTFSEAAQVPPVIFPSRVIWENYTEVLRVLPFDKYYFNTAITTISRTLGQVVLCSMAAYAFARIEFPGRNLIFMLCLSVLMVPGQIFIIPQFLIMKDLGWLNSLQALIVPGIFSAFGTFLLRQFFMTLPKDVEEAAKLDGCNHFHTYWRIMLPMVKPALIALIIFTALASWNELLWPLIVNTSPDKMTLAAGIASLKGQYTTDYPTMMAGTLMATLPMIVMFIVLQRYFIEGIALTGSKG